jgi:hypothetical protein
MTLTRQARQPPTFPTTHTVADEPFPTIQLFILGIVSSQSVFIKEPFIDDDSSYQQYVDSPSRSP